MERSARARASILLRDRQATGCHTGATNRSNRSTGAYHSSGVRVAGGADDARAVRDSHRGVWSEYSGHCTGAAMTVPYRACVICASGNANAAAMIGAR
ncbi:hypothetical protein A8E18_03110 [Burkholderia cenocepacia]|nr:hypothetical protein A8E18_03110 [Burkholderia cenocepacia]